MSNPLEGLRIYKVSGQMVNNQKSKLTVDYENGEKFDCIISINWSKSGVCRAYINYMPESWGQAGGCGYDKEGVAFAKAINATYGTDYRNHGEGVDFTIKQMQTDGFTVRSLSQC